MKTPTLPDHELSARQRRAVTDKPTSGSNDRKPVVAGKRHRAVKPPPAPKYRRLSNGQFTRAPKLK